ncbi:MAG TPA: IPT/TIG domain-containing protein, partial [Bryobacteraceae bacterium]|nr:IPT/TIG domain-containing protein [Bryobacteraceae bacterium]
IAGLIVEAQDMNGTKQTITSSVTENPGVTLGNNAVAYAESVPVGAQLVQVQETGSTFLSQKLTLRAGAGNAVIVKPGPSVTGAVTAGSAIFPYNVAANGYVAVYGSNLTTMSQSQSAGVPYPMQLGDVQVLINGTPAQIQFISPNQLNIVYPNFATGFTQLTVKSSAGQQTLNVIVASAVPSIFTQADGSAAARIGDLNGDPVVTATEPLHFGDTVELYLTGLGQTAVGSNGLNDAQIQPTVTVGGQNCPVTYAGLVPAFTGFDQIDCQIPSGISGSALPVIVTSNGRASNTATLNVQ